jgi:hypothetical protein
MPSRIPASYPELNASHRAEAVVGLIIAAVAVREGRDAWNGKTCCTPVVDIGAENGQGCHDGCCSEQSEVISAAVAQRWDLMSGPGHDRARTEGVETSIES